MNFKRHVVTPLEQVVDLNEEEIALLETTGPKHWIIAVPCENVETVKVLTELKDRTNEELKNLCGKLGIKYNTRDNKTELISRIEDAQE